MRVQQTRPAGPTALPPLRPAELLPHQLLEQRRALLCACRERDEPRALAALQHALARTVNGHQDRAPTLAALHHGA